MDIRKISVGPDYKSSSMHYIVGQDVLNGAYKIHLIKQEEGEVKIWIEKEDEVILWKSFNDTMPIAT